ncbi:MAG: hypothetical protein MR911_12395 [Spirochaetia bacterium]|nr:hypothetical protein [Spirochaetia bacterium]MDY4768575.1 hypothetical protein [Treponema sp.]
MATSVNLSSILRNFATKQESPFVYIRDFCDYIKKYAAKNLEQQPNLVQYIEISESSLTKELEELASKHEVYLTTQGGKPVVIVITYYSVLYANRFKDIVSNITVPFPCVTDLPKQLPVEAIEKTDASEIIPKLQQEQDVKSPVLYCMMMPRDIPAILFPACVPVQFLTRAAMAKIRHMLKKDEYHDYFQKKLRNANPTKEIGSQTFYTRFLQHPDNADQTFDFNGDAFYFWSQLCYFIRIDFEKIKDRTIEDINVLQALSICEIWMMSLKEKANAQQVREDALRELEAALARPPFFYSMDSILKIRDSKGALLYGQYNEDDLKEFLQKLTTESENNELPKILVFKVETGARYFIYKQRVFQLVVRLANEAHDTIEKDLTDKWFNSLSEYRKLPEMKDKKAFETVLKDEVRTLSPVLWSLLNANFLTMLNYENDHSENANSFHIFSNGKLLPYSELLMLSNSSILSTAKIMLPFWHTIPILSWIMSIINSKKNEKKPRKKAIKEFSADDIPDDTPKQSPGRYVNKKEAVIEAARNVADELVPSGSTIDRELDSYLKLWNKMITKEAHASLTEDVNSLIRDYTRKVMRTISASTFTVDRVRTLAETLVKTPNMQKIKENDALTMYVELYILRLLSNS